MATSVLVDSVETNLTGYSIQEDATPLDPSDTTGGVGQIDYSVNEDKGPEGSVQLEGLDISLSDPFRGLIVGTVTDVSGQDGVVSVTADGRLGALVGTVSAKPFVGTFQDAIYYLLSLGGVTTGIVIDPAIAFLPVAMPGFSDEVWLRLKQLTSVHGSEIALVGDKIVFRPARSFKSNTQKQTDFSWEVQKGDAAQFVEVTYYGNTWVDKSVIYPYTTDERANAQTWQVDQGAVLEDDIDVSLSLATIDQPRVSDTVDQDYGLAIGADDDDVDTALSTDAPGRGLSSVYTVTDTDNNPVTAQNWTAAGGKIEASINDDTRSVHIKITGPENMSGGPFRIVGRTGTGDDAADYPSLFLVGTGVYIDPQVLRVPTGVTPGTSVTEVGTTVQVESVATKEDAYDVAVRVANGWSGTQQTISGTLTSINKIGATGSVEYPTFADFNAEHTGQTIAAFNTAWAGQTFKAFDDAEFLKVNDSFDNQTFGNVAGARLPFRNAWYRVTSATITDELITFDGRADTTYDDFNTSFAGYTIADFNTKFAGKTFRQFARIPLNTKDSTGVIVVPPVPTSQYPDEFYPDNVFPADEALALLAIIEAEDGSFGITGSEVTEEADETFTISGDGVTLEDDGTYTLTDA